MYPPPVPPVASDAVCSGGGGDSVIDDSLFVVAPIVLGLSFIVYFLLSFLVCCHLAEV